MLAHFERETMRRLSLIMLVLVVAPVLVAASAPKTTVLDIPINRSVFVSCAHGGAGDTIAVTGTLHTVSTVVDSGSGKTLVRESFNPMGATGIGQSGDVYRGAGSTSTLEMTLASGTQTTMVNNFLMIGPGPGNNLLIHTLTHVTNEGGEIRASIDNISIECR